MRKLFPIFLSLLIISCGKDNESPGPLDLSGGLQTTNPAAVGADRAQLELAVDNARAIPRFRSLLVMDDGFLISESYFQADRHTLHDVRSVTKSIVSTLTLKALEEGHINDLEDEIGEYVGEDIGLEENQKKIRIIDLLTMSSGFEWDEWTNTSYNDWILSGDHLNHLLGLPMINQPGEVFTYNSAAVHLLGVVLEHAVGQTLPEYANEVLFYPLGITSVDWEQLSDGYVNGGAGIDLSARDLAKFGMLFLKHGMISDAERILEETMINEATAPFYEWRSTSGPVSGLSYGYLWWTVESPYEAYMAWGYGGQFVVVVPSLDAVVVATTDWTYVSQEPGGPSALTDKVLSVIYEDVLPALQ